MQAMTYLVLGPNSIDGGANRSSPINHRRWALRRCSHVASAMSSAEQNHYAVLGVPPTASFAIIKKAYRLLALKYHPDVSKDSQSDDVFKSIRLAYDVLSDETSRNHYDRALKLHTEIGKPLQENWDLTQEVDDEIRLYRWDDLRRRMRTEKYREKFHSRHENIQFDEETDNKSEEESNIGKERVSFIEVIKSTFLSLFLLQTIGARLSLTFSTLTALLDRKLDNGYKMGYMIAWVLGGKSGVLLTLCLSFASWVCGKTSSSLVALVAVAMWIGSNIARYAPLPQGALLTLLYMSSKLQSDLN